MRRRACSPTTSTTSTRATPLCPCRRCRCARRSARPSSSCGPTGASPTSRCPRARTRRGASRGNGDVVDGFEYEASDGVQVASAAVTLRAGSANLPPVPVEGAPPVVAPVGAFVFVDLSGRFEDPEGAPLSFSIVEPLPDDGSLALSPGGTLAGVPGPGDVGEYPLTLVADDGEAAAAAPLLLVVEPDPALADDASLPGSLPGPPPGPEFVPGHGLRPGRSARTHRRAGAPGVRRPGFRRSPSPPGASRCRAASSWTRRAARWPAGRDGPARSRASSSRPRTRTAPRRPRRRSRSRWFGSDVAAAPAGTAGRAGEGERGEGERRRARYGTCAPRTHRGP